MAIEHNFYEPFGVTLGTAVGIVRSTACCQGEVALIVAAALFKQVIFKSMSIAIIVSVLTDL